MFIMFCLPLGLASADVGTSQAMPTAVRSAVSAVMHSRGSGRVLDILLPAVGSAEMATLQQKAARAHKPMQIGFGRLLPAPFDNDIQPFLKWVQESDGSETAVFTVTSPGALALRLGVEVSRLDDASELYFFGMTMLQQPFGPYTAKEMRNQRKDANSRTDHDIYWSPIVEGETIAVAVWRPGAVQGRSI